MWTSPWLNPVVAAIVLALAGQGWLAEAAVPGQPRAGAAPVAGPGAQPAATAPAEAAPMYPAQAEAVTFAAQDVKFENPDKPGSPRIVWVKRIWEDARWNGRGELIRFKDNWYCCFKEGMQHTNESLKDLPVVGIRIITSPDALTWTSVVKFQNPDVLWENATLLVTPDGRLMCVICQDNPRDADRAAIAKKYPLSRMWVAFSKDGAGWTAPRLLRYHDAKGNAMKVGGEIFHMAWHEGKAYCMPRGAGLFVSTDGIDYAQATRGTVAPAGARFGGNENALRVLPDGEIVVLCRNNNPPGAIACSKPPYADWSVTQIPHSAQGPNFIALPSGAMWAVTRDPKSGGGSTTVLFRMTRKTYEPVLTLPSGGDTSYAGLVWHDGHLWVSYYSSHEGGKARMYLAKIMLPEQR